ncbi:MAG: Gfo/Idh/MocA family protein, partial [Steroidobacteraceae bacterium]
MVRVALIGTGLVTLQNHIPGVRLHPAGEVVALCDPDPRALAEAAEASGIRRTFSDYGALMRDPDVDAVVIATPNHMHAPISLAAIETGKHVLCEKPLGMNHAETEAMSLAAQKAGVVNMTAFTYRFIPAIRWMQRLIREGAIGTLYHIRSRRLQDWGDRALGWRQHRALCGSGVLGDMLAHRIDYVHHLVGPFSRLVAHTRQLVPDRRRPDGTLEKSDVEDWVAVIAEVGDGVTAVLESTKVATGRGTYLHSEDFVEINGSNGTLVYRLENPHELLIGRPGQMLEAHAVPDHWLTAPGSPRNPLAGDPLQAFRYDQGFEFIQAIVEGRA